MPYDPSTGEIQRLRADLHRLQLDHDGEVRDRRRDRMDLESRLSLIVMVGIVAVVWIACAILLVVDYIRDNCSCG